MSAFLASLVVHLALFALFFGLITYEPAPPPVVPIEISLFEKALKVAADHPKGTPQAIQKSKPVASRPEPAASTHGTAAPIEPQGSSDAKGEPLAEEYEVAQMPLLLNEVKIPYPASAKNRGIQGPVIFDLIISSKGSVSNAVVITSPDPELSTAATAAVYRFKFRPAVYGDKSVAIKIRYTYRFVLQ